MPSQASLKAASGKTPPKGKGKIPAWGWIAAAGIGLLIGFFLLKNPGRALSQAGTGSSEPSPQGSGGSPSGGANVIGLDDLLKALGLIPGQGTVPSETTTNPQVQQDPTQQSAADYFAANPLPQGTTTEQALAALSAFPAQSYDFVVSDPNAGFSAFTSDNPAGIPGYSTSTIPTATTSPDPDVPTKPGFV